MAMERKPILKYLLGALAGVATVGLVLLVLWGGPWLLTRYPQQGLTAEQELKAKNDVRTTLVQAVAGLAVASGAIVTYRTFRRTRLEQDRAYDLSQSRQVTETFAKAVEQLGHERAPVRLGGLHSLVGLAQDNPSRRQTVVDVLCAYLRMPYTPPMRDTAQSAPVAAEDPGPVDPTYQKQEQERDTEQEFQVRQTAQRCLAAHLRRPPGTLSGDAQRIKACPEETFWPGISLDLTGATLVDPDLHGISVVQASCARAIFSGAAWFGDATFSGYAGFDQATFTGAARFGGATFTGDAGFHRATFTGAAGFVGATFTGYAGFDQATFTGTAGFDRATFTGDAGFNQATFTGPAGFRGTTFSGDARFDAAHVLRLNDPDLNKDGRRVWPDGWTVRPDEDDPTRGTLVPSAAGADND
jgi:uncharacterized protein YjbI with pentapeptide repeats